MTTPAQTSEKLFSPYQVFIIVILSILQFSVILDFMVLSPLSAILLPGLQISTAQFGLVVSAYAFSAGAASLLAAGFADKFDRKKMLLFFYTGFLIGTVLCALAPDYSSLLIARVVTGVFGGVVGSIGFAIVTDLFRYEIRGRVMGFMQMSFGAAQILGLPIGVLLATKFSWHAPFWLIAGFGAIIGVLIVLYMRPVNEHLKIRAERNAFQHLVKTVSTPDYLKAFLCTTLLATGGFMMMPFGAAFSTNNLGLSLDDLPIIYGITGVFSFAGPFIGKIADRYGKLPVFVVGTMLSMLMVAYYTRLEVTPLWTVCLISVIMFTGINSRMISSSALVSAMPAPQDRGAFMSINAATQQVSGGIASAVAGLIIFQAPSGHLERYEMLGYAVNATMLITIGMMVWINSLVKARQARNAVA